MLGTFPKGEGYFLFAYRRFDCIMDNRVFIVGANSRLLAILASNEVAVSFARF